MFIELHNPDRLAGHDLDAYLKLGWFRRGPAIFTTNFVHLDNQILSTIWLRVRLFTYEQEHVHKRLLKQNARFTTRVALASLTEEKELLFTKYKVTRPFTSNESLHRLLFGKEGIDSVYNTYEVTIHDHDKLIGCSFFDLGESSAQSIISFYDPDYKNYSLGKFLIYSQMQFCKDLGYQYFYPGYFVPGSRFFYYKLDIGKEALEYFDYISGSWRDYHSFSVDDTPINLMRCRLEILSHLMRDIMIESHLLKYEHFDQGLLPYLRKAKVLQFPIFLLPGPLTKDPATIITVYDLQKEEYCLKACKPAVLCEQPNPDPSFYSAYIIKPIEDIYATADPGIMCEVISDMMSHKVTAIK